MNIIEALRKGKKDEKIDYLTLKAEVELVDLDLEHEFQNCFQELKNLVLKDKLNNISREIKEAEQNKDLNRIQELTQKFNDTLNYGEEKTTAKTEKA